MKFRAIAAVLAVSALAVGFSGVASAQVQMSESVKKLYEAAKKEGEVTWSTSQSNAEYAEDGVTIQCKDADARAAGCVPLNVFGVGSITPEMAAWLRVNPTIDSSVEQTQALAYVSGLERVDEGLASIYRAVQGLALDDPLQERKRGLLQAAVGEGAGLALSREEILELVS